MKWFREEERNAEMNYEKEIVAAHMREHCKEETERMLAEADRLTGQVFTFTDAWDMEPCAVPYRLEPMTWDRTPNGDPEWIYMLNRHDYLNKLLQAYLVTGERRYSDQVIWYLRHWIQNNPICAEGGATIRTIDTGIRCMNWISLLLRMQAWNLVEEEIAEEVLSSLNRQFSYMKDSYIDKYTLSNWGLLQTGAICYGYLWFEEALPKEGLKEWAWEELRTQLGLQIMEDGAHWEQSVMYHMEVLNCCMKLLAGCRYAGEPVPEWLEEAVRRMSRYVLFAAGPDHCQLAQADSDVTDVRDVLTKAAVLCGDGKLSRELRHGGHLVMDLDSVWLLGGWGLHRYEELRSREPEERSMVCMDTGNLYLRSSWQEEANYTYLHCGPLGSAHGHGDLTHMCLYYRGEPFLIDSGRYSYREEETLRMEFKEAGAHNVCIVDGQSPAKANGSWSYDSYGEPWKNYYNQRGPLHYTEMAYLDEAGAGEVCLVRRKVMFHEAGIWLVVEDICCKGEHQAEQIWHLDSHVVPETLPNVRGQMEGGTGRMLLRGERSALNLWSETACETMDCRISKRYNELENSRKLVRTLPFTDRLTDWCCFAGEGMEVRRVPVFRAGQTEPEDATRVTALEVTGPEVSGTIGESWIFLLWNRETFCGNKLYFCKGIPVYGRAAVLRLANGRHIGTLRL